MKNTILVLSLSLTSMVSADQPIFNKLPRWSDGYGVQFVEEYRHERDLLLGDEKVGEGLSEDVHILHIEGVYTWERWIRLTVKIPYILHAEREILDENDNVQRETDQGLGDITLALPLKKYFNLDGRSGSWTLAPQLRIPTAGTDSYEIGDGEWGAGLFMGYETETVNWFVGGGVNLWTVDGQEPFQAGLSFDFGRNIFAFGSSGQFNWETDCIWEDDGSFLLSAGPSIYWKVNDTVHFRADWKHDYIDYRGVLDHGNGEAVSIGIGLVY